MQRIIFIFLLFNSILFPQITPLEKKNFQELTSYEELKNFIKEIDNNYDFIESDILTKTVEGRELYILYFSKDKFGKDENKLRVLFFAQQHGNEQSGKEGALLLIKALTKPENQKIFDRIDFAIIPQMNPDGSEKNQRRNANGVDLNRNHLILTENETRALHDLFNKFNFDVTLDIHEYFPYTTDWQSYGFFKNADEQLGLLTNPNIDIRLKTFQKEKVLPYVENYLKSKGYSFCEYVVGGPPDKERLRHSTIDINDGRQSFGILNTLSFILEGKNGKDSFIENIEKRAKGQFETMFSLIMFCFENHREIKELVTNARKNILSKSDIILQADHFPDGSIFDLPAKSVENLKDTILKISNYHPLIKVILKLNMPEGYLIYKNDSLLIDFLQKHNIYYSSKIPSKKKIYQYEILKVDSILLEGEYLKNPTVERKSIKIDSEENNYIFIPSNQFKRDLIALALEPQSMVGLIQYEKYVYLLNSKKYPILRVEK